MKINNTKITNTILCVILVLLALGVGVDHPLFLVVYAGILVFTVMLRNFPLKKFFYIIEGFMILGFLSTQLIKTLILSFHIMPTILIRYGYYACILVIVLLWISVNSKLNSEELYVRKIRKNKNAKSRRRKEIEK